MIVAELLASLGVQVDQKSLKNVDSALSGVAKTATKILGGITAVFGGVAAGAFIKDLIAVGGELDDASRRFGVSTGALQAWRYAAQQTGASAEAVGNSMKFAAKNAYDAANGGKESAKAFKALGVEVKGADGKVRDTEAVYLDTLNALAGVENNSERTALALKVLGRGATDMLPLIAQGADGIAKLRAEFEELGGGYSEEFVAQADQLGDSLDALTQNGKALRSMFGVAVFPILQRGVDILISLGKGFNRITKGTRLVKAALGVMVAAFTAWGIAAMWAARQAIVAWVAAAAPFLLVAVALTALALILDDIAALLTGGKSLIGKYLDEWFGVGTVERLVSDWTGGVVILTETITAMGDTIAQIATDTVTFWGDAVSQLVDDWIGGIDIIVDKVQSFADWVIEIGSAIAGALDPTGTLRDSIRKTWGAVSDLLPDMPDMPDMPAMGGGVAYVDRVTRDGSPFLNSLTPGVASQGAVHPAFRTPALESAIGPGSVPVPAAATPGVNVTTNAPITVNATEGQSPRAVAREVRRELDARESAQADRVRRALVNRGQ